MAEIHVTLHLFSQIQEGDYELNLIIKADAGFGWP